MPGVRRVINQMGLTYSKASQKVVRDRMVYFRVDVSDP